MIYLPIFGKDSLPQSSSRIIGFSATVLFWVLILCIFSLINSKEEKKERYVTVQIVLEDKEPVIEEIIPDSKKIGGQEGSQEIVEDNSEPVIQTVAQVKTTAPKISNNVQKTSSASKLNSSVKSNPDTKSSVQNEKSFQSAPTDYSKSVDDLMSAQLNGTKKAAVWDESLFKDTANSSTNSTTSQNSIIDKETTFSGTAASVNNSDTSQKSSSKAKTNDISNASDSTSQALSRISSASYSSTSEGSKTTSSMNTSKSSEGKLQIEMQDGTVRTLLEPLYPSISLSKEASDLIDSKVVVTITFRVNENGNVLQVSFQNHSSLPETVKNEIESQILRWRFESASFSSIATFKYTIEKK